MLDRRHVLIAGAAGAALATLPAGVFAQNTPEAGATVEDAIAQFTGGAEVVDGDGVRLIAPEIAENGNTVPVEVDAPGAAEIILLAAGNPTPGVFSAKFGELSPSQKLATRIRLAQTQDVVAIAKMPDGSFVRTASEVKVTIGGCGG